MEKIIGIYKITSPSGKIYIGQSTNCEIRFRDYRARKNNKQTRLSNSFKKYGAKNHTYEIIHRCNKEELDELEKQYINIHNSAQRGVGLNLMTGGGGVGHHSQETKDKIGLAQRGKKLSEEHKFKIGNSQRGKIVPKEVGQKISIALKGLKRSEESKQKQSKSATGKKRSKQTCENISKSLIGRIITEETKIKISKSHIGKKASDTTKLKMSIKRKGVKFKESHKNKIKLALTGKKHAKERILKNSISQKLAWEKRKKQGTNKQSKDTIEKRLSAFRKTINERKKIKNQLKLELE